MMTFEASMRKMIVMNWTSRTAVSGDDDLRMSEAIFPKIRSAKRMPEARVTTDLLPNITPSVPIRATVTVRARFCPGSISKGLENVIHGAVNR